MYKFIILSLSLFYLETNINAWVPNSGPNKFKKELVILTINSHTTIFKDKDGKYAGIEHDMVDDFAKSLGAVPRFVLYHSIEEVIRALKRGDGDMAAAGLTITPNREKLFSVGPVYQEVEEYVVCNDKVKVRKLVNLGKAKILIPKDTSYEESLNKLKVKIPDLKFDISPILSTEEILLKMWRGEVECSVVDSNIIDVNRHFYPELRKLFPLGQKEKLAWMVPKKKKELVLKMDQWFEKIKKDGRLKILMERYYGHVENFDYVDNKVFLERSKNRLPRYLHIFKKAAKRYNFNWKLVAAVSYQESHWNPRAKSPTGVRGLMMLTLSTAKHYGIKNRLNAEQSIMGGAQYLRSIITRIPNYIPYPDRLWMALAAYNVGLYHLRDARALSVWQEKNPNNWVSLKEVLPLLAIKKYYHLLPFGAARGLEPVRYVKRIRNYYNVLKNTEI